LEICSSSCPMGAPENNLHRRRYCHFVKYHIIKA
jgi:hypothetical protein